MTDSLDRFKVLVNSNTPIILLETVEEARALALVRRACLDLDLPLFEWSIADGLRRSVASSSTPTGDFTGPILNTTLAAQVLAHIETMTIEAVFVLKDFHRHLDDAVVVRRLRNLAQQFARTRRALVLAGPPMRVPEELEKQVEHLPLPMPDRAALRQVIESTYERLARRQKIKRSLDPTGLAAMAANLSGLTEEEAERAVAQALVSRSELSAAVIEDVLQAKKALRIGWWTPAAASPAPKSKRSYRPPCTPRSASRNP